MLAPTHYIVLFMITVGCGWLMLFPYILALEFKNEKAKELFNIFVLFFFIRTQIRI